jgi:PKD repeat protein
MMCHLYCTHIMRVSSRLLVSQAMTKVLTAVAAEAPTVRLTVEITSSDDEEGEVAPATFEFEADVTGGTEPYTYSWDFDGESSEEIDDDETEHTFEEAGTYNVGLTVTDSSGQSASDSMGITIDEAPAEEDNSDSDDLFDVDDLLTGLDLDN